jgi:hypothetical protein
VIGLSCHRHLWRLLHKLDAGVEASGPHGFAVRLKRIRQSAIRVHRIPPRVRDDREPPLRWDETAEISEVIWGQVEADYFSREDWTGQISLIHHDKSSFRRMSMEPSRRCALRSR